MDIVRRSSSGVKDNIGVSSVEVSLELFGDRFQVHLLYSPNLQARCFTCTLELLVENHDSWKYTGTRMLGLDYFLKIQTVLRPNDLKLITTERVVKQMHSGTY